MTTARDIMTGSPIIVAMEAPVADIARTLESENIGAVIVCGDDGGLQGMITDRDLAIGVIAAGLDPSTTAARDLVSGREVVTIGADDSVDVAIQTMEDHAVRRLPVIDGRDVIGIISQADLAVGVGDSRVGALVEEISEAPDNTGRG